MKTKNRTESMDSFFLVMCVLGLFAILSSTMSKNPVLPLFAESLGTPADLMGFIAAASTIPGILVSLPAGSLSDIFGRRKLLILSGVIFASAPFLYLLVVSPMQLALVRFYHGFATAIFVPVINAAIVERFPKSRGEKMSTFSSITVIGRSTAPFLGGYILFITSSNYHNLYSLVGVAGIVAFLMTVALHEHRIQENGTQKPRDADKASKSPKVFRDWGEVARNSGIITVSLVEAAQYYTFGAFEFFFVLYAQSIGLDSFLIGTIFAAQLVTVVFVKPLTGWLSDRFGRKNPIFLGLVCGSVPLIATPFTNQFAQLIAISMAYGFGFSLVTSSTIPLASELTRKELYGSTMGFISTIMDVGQALGPIITGLILATSAGFTGAFASLAVILLGSWTIFLVWMRTRAGTP